VGAASAEASKRRVVSGGGTASVPTKSEDEDDELAKEVLVVVSKLKGYVRARSGMNTSDGVVDVLSDHLRDLCRKAVRSAAQNSRKTVLARDFEAVLEGRNATE
jgi:histone H3/H4